MYPTMFVTVSPTFMNFNVAELVVKDCVHDHIAYFIIIYFVVEHFKTTNAFEIAQNFVSHRIYRIFLFSEILIILNDAKSCQEQPCHLVSYRFAFKTSVFALTGGIQETIVNVHSFFLRSVAEAAELIFHTVSKKNKSF